MEQINMGFAEVDITPTKPVQLVGYDVRPDNLSRGILHRLVAQTMVWESKEEKCCLIAIDSLGFTVALTNGLRNQVAKALSIDMENVMVCFSHTHAAPNAAIEKEYYVFVCQQIMVAVEQAIQLMFPVQAAWGVAANEVGVNRRGSEHIFDDRLGILKITGLASNDLQVLVVRIATHANVLMSDNYLISADYFGTTRALLEQKFDCKVVLLQGASGDVRPKYRQDNAIFLEIHPVEAAQQVISAAEQENYNKQSMQSLDNIAMRIYQAVDGVIHNLHPQPITSLALFSVRHTFHADVPTDKRALEIAKEAKRYAGIDGTGWLQEVQRLQQEKITRQSSIVEIQYFIVGDGCICGVPNEVMSEIALVIAKKANQQLLFFNGYTNGIESYLPSAEEYDKGGYEVLWSNLLYYIYHGRVMPFNRDTADCLATEVIRAWDMFWKNKERDKQKIKV